MNDMEDFEFSKVFILEYDYSYTTMKYERAPMVHNLEVYKKFEDVMAEYRKRVSARDMFDEPYATNIRVYRQELSNQIDMNVWL